MVMARHFKIKCLQFVAETLLADDSCSRNIKQLCNFSLAYNINFSSVADTRKGVSRTSTAKSEAGAWDFVLVQITKRPETVFLPLGFVALPFSSF